MQLYNQYRPLTLADIAGHKREKAFIARSQLTGCAWWITGKPGIGKSSFAGIMAGMVADPLNVHQIDAGDVTPAKLADYVRESQSLAIGEKPGRAYVINEAHRLRADVVPKLCNAFDVDQWGVTIPDHVTWIFTTTIEGHKSFDGIDSAPLLSRCRPLNLKPDRDAFARRAMEIAEDAGLGGAPFDEYVRLAEFCDDNLRMMLSQIEAGCMLEPV